MVSSTGQSNSRFRLAYLFVAAWLAFTLSLTAWWVVFGIRQIEAMRALDPSEETSLIRHQTMLLWEGATLFISLTLGAGALLFLTYRSTKQATAIQEFLAVFTHELKTPLASLRLQAEALEDEPSINQALVQRLVADTTRLNLRLDNALFVATQGKYTFLNEPVNTRQALTSLSTGWPGLAVTITGDQTIYSDRRALDTIFSNIFQNAVSHGKASAIDIILQGDEQSQWIITRDNGVGFSGEKEVLGKLFNRSYGGSGSGIGLYIVQRLMQLQGARRDLIPVNLPEDSELS